MRVRVSSGILLVVLSAVPMVLIATRAISYNRSRVSDPCLQWGQSTVVTDATVPQSPGDPCHGSVSITSETKVQAKAFVLLISGGVLVASSLALLGAGIRRPLLIVAGACVMFLEAVPMVWSFGWLAVLTGGAFLLIAKKVSYDVGRTPIAST